MPLPEPTVIFFQCLLHFVHPKSGNPGHDPKNRVARTGFKHRTKRLLRIVQQERPFIYSEQSNSSHIHSVVKFGGNGQFHRFAIASLLGKLYYICVGQRPVTEYGEKKGGPLLPQPLDVLLQFVHLYSFFFLLSWTR